MNKSILIGFVAILFIGILGFVYLTSQKNSRIIPPNVGDGGLIEETQLRDEEMPNLQAGYQGIILAGNVTPYIDFNQADYEKALSEGKIVLLNFYADWCPVCRAEEPDLFEGFNALSKDNVVGFRVNFKDANTDEYEKNLAEQFQIPYQHTKVFLLADTEIGKFIATKWDSEQLIAEIEKVTR